MVQFRYQYSSCLNRRVFYKNGPSDTGCIWILVALVMGALAWSEPKGTYARYKRLMAGTLPDCSCVVVGLGHLQGPALDTANGAVQYDTQYGQC